MTNHTDLPITGYSNLLRRALDVMDDCYSYAHDCYENVEDIEDARKEVWEHLRKIKQLKTDLRTAIETGGWLPIEEAKKDGTPYLLHVPPKPDHEDTFVGSFDGYQWANNIDGYPCIPDYCMPLPPPPNSPNREVMIDLQKLLAEAAVKLNKVPGEVQWWAWPQLFSSTSGPHGGVGGQAFTVFQAFGFESTDGKRVKYCSGVWRPWDGKQEWK